MPWQMIITTNCNKYTLKLQFFIIVLIPVLRLNKYTMSVMYMLEEHVFVNWFFFKEHIIFLWSYQLWLGYSFFLFCWCLSFMLKVLLKYLVTFAHFSVLRIEAFKADGFQALVVLWIWSEGVNLLCVYFPMLYSLRFNFSPLWPLPSLIILLRSLMYHLSYLPFSSEFFFCKNSFTVILSRE